MVVAAPEKWRLRLLRRCVLAVLKAFLPVAGVKRRRVAWEDSLSVFPSREAKKVFLGALANGSYMSFAR